ncbi:MAG: hypothetical protein HC842_09595, partial [Cytophagales bacterium]|nr:hypothetical protein [Cytophagales bacterium]
MKETQNPNPSSVVYYGSFLKQLYELRTSRHDNFQKLITAYLGVATTFAGWNRYLVSALIGDKLVKICSQPESQTDLLPVEFAYAQSCSGQVVSEQEAVLLPMILT